MNANSLIWKIILLLGLVLLLFGPEKALRFFPTTSTTNDSPIKQKYDYEEETTVKIFEQMSPSVVSIQNAAISRDFFSLNVYEVPQGAGSGVVWDNQGHIVTNFHVIYKADAIRVTLYNGESVDAKIIGVAPDYDLAVLKIDSNSTLNALPLGNSNELKVGQKVLALGNPFGLDGTLTTGIISALGRTIDSLTGYKIREVIQTDAAINPGNSGGALLDRYGRLIAINTAILSPSGTNSGIGFAIPIATINRIVPQIIKSGKFSRVGLGVVLVPDNIRNKWGIQGAMVLQCAPNSSAKKAGLIGMTMDRFGRRHPGDVVIKINDQPIYNNTDLMYFLEKFNEGDQVEITFLRQAAIKKTKLLLQNLE